MSGANANCKTTKGMTPIHFASEKGNVEAIKLLLSGNADVNVRANNMLTPLYLAVKNSHGEAAKCLMDHGASIDAEFKNGETILSLAVCNDHSMIVEDILKYCPDTNNATNKSCLKIAVKKSCRNTIVENLLKYGFNVEPDDINDTIFLHKAIEMGYIQIIQDLIKHGLDLDGNKEENCTILHIAAKYKRVEIAKLLLAHGADVNAADKAGKPAVYYSTENSDVIMTKLLLSHGASVQKSPELLSVATKNVCKEIVEILLQNKVDIEASDNDGWTALHLTALNEYDRDIWSLWDDDDELDKIEKRGEIAKLLLSMGANVNSKTNKLGLTPLLIACQNGLRNVVQVLLEYKADVNYGDCSPLLIAAQRGDASIMEMLIENGAHVNAKQKNGDTALHIVAKKDFEDALKVLLKNGADVYSRNSNDATPLHKASKEGNYIAVYILLQHGSPINWRNKYGDTPLHLSASTLNFGLVKLLLDSGSDINMLTKNNCTAADIALFSHRRQFHSHQFKYDAVCYVLKFHLVRLKTANLYVMVKNLYFLNNYQINDDFDPNLQKKKCDIEIKKLKLEKMANNKLSLYDVLTKNTHSIASYAKNKDVIGVLESRHYKTKFPIYAPIIESNFKKVTQRRALLDQAQEFFKYYNELPLDCCDQILRYLSDSDLENIINVWKTPSVG